MAKTKRKWPDHPLVGRKITFKKNGESHPAEIVDVKCGPMFFNRSELSQPDVKIRGTLCVRLKPDSGEPEFWTPPFEYNEETTKETDNG